jgi:hypothetical protein
LRLNHINLNELPREAQKELLDFYEFLLQKYKKKKVKKKIEEIIPRKAKAFKPIKKDKIHNNMQNLGKNQY